MSYPPPPDQNQGYGYQSAPQQNQKALWSMILGIVSLFCCGIITGVVAVILGGQAKSEIAQSNGTQTGEGMAKAGVITGWIGIALTVLGIIAWVLLVVVAGTAEMTSDY